MDGGVDEGVRDPACLRALAVFGHPGAGASELCHRMTEEDQTPLEGYTGPWYGWIDIDF